MTGTRRQRRTAVVAALVVLATAGLSGCGLGRAVSSARSVASEVRNIASSAPPSSTTTSAPVDVCSLVTAAQASALTHDTYDTTQSIDNDDFHGCKYHNANTTDRGDTLDMDITTTTTAGCWSTVTAGDGPGTPVSGVGDSAFGTSLELDVKSGDRCLTVEGQTLAESQNDWSADVAMARQVLQGLGAS